MTRVTVALALLGCLLSVNTADAKCKGPGVAFAPASGVMVKGVTWVFVPTRRVADTKITVTSRLAVETEITEVSANDTFTTYRVQVVGADAGRIGTIHYDVVVGSKYRSQSASYSIPHQDFVQRSGAVSLEDAELESDSWTCSHTNAIVATPSIGAPAYRLEWASTEADYRAGRVKRLIVPWSMDAFWGRDGEAPKIELGHLNCFGETISESELTAGVYLGVTALYSGDEASPVDPIEVVLADPVRVVDVGPPADEVAPIEEPVEYHCGYRPEPPSAAVSTPSRMAPLFGILFGLLFGVFGCRRLGSATRERLDAWSVPQVGVLLAAIPAVFSQSSAIAGCISGTVVLASFAVATAASVLAGWVQLNR